MLIAAIAFALAGIGTLGLAVALWIKLFKMVFGKPKPVASPEPVNPYVKAHSLKMANDEMYQDYLEWLKVHGSGVPIGKVQAFEDWQADQKIRDLL